MIVGEGPEKRKLKQLAGELGILDRVLFVGHIEDVREALSWFDVFTLSSDTEQMPNSVLQAMAAGRPIAALDVGDIRRMVSPENRSYIVKRNDSAAYVRALDDLLQNPSARTRIGLDNQSYARVHHGVEGMFAAYRNLFEEATGLYRQA